MTLPDRSDPEGLKPCPFCGGAAEIVDIAEGENAGGSCISCTQCLASSNVEFERKENFVSNWNRRSSSPSERGAVEDKAAILECLCRARCAEFSVDPDKIINREGEEIHQWRWMIEKADLDLADAILSRLGRA